jgi:hypothetical protein
MGSVVIHWRKRSARTWPVRAGFRHEDDEFVAAVAGDHVRLAGLLLEQAADAGEHEIALEVAHGVIDFLELVEIDQHHGERASGAGSALPLGRQSFPEEAAGFDSGEAVGDRLLLQLLEDEGIVQAPWPAGRRAC